MFLYCKFHGPDEGTMAGLQGLYHPGETERERGWDGKAGGDLEKLFPWRLRTDEEAHCTESYAKRRGMASDSLEELDSTKAAKSSHARGRGCGHKSIQDNLGK